MLQVITRKEPVWIIPVILMLSACQLFPVNNSVAVGPGSAECTLELEDIPIQGVVFIGEPENSSNRLVPAVGATVTVTSDTRLSPCTDTPLPSVEVTLTADDQGRFYFDPDYGLNTMEALHISVRMQGCPETQLTARAGEMADLPIFELGREEIDGLPIYLQCADVRFLPILLICAFAVACTQTPQFIGPVADCESLTINITGVVRDENGNPISGAVITIQNQLSDCPQTKPIQLELYSDSEGFFQIGPVETGTSDFVTYQVSADGYQDYIYEGTMISDAIGEWEITLQPEEEAATPDT